MDLYQSKIGEIKSKDQWLAWLDQFYERLGLNDEAIKISRPDDGWDRAVRVLQLNKIERP